MAREDELKKVLEQLANGTIDASAASKALEGMFSRIESDMGKIRESDTAPGEGVENTIKVQYVGLTDTISAMGAESVESLGRTFGSFRTMYNEQLQQTIAGTAQLNKALSKSGANIMRTFSDFKGLSLQATNDTQSLMKRSVDSLLKTMTMDKIKPFLVSTTLAFKENFKAIAFEVPEVEAKYYKLAAAFDAMGVNAKKSATYFQDLKNIGRMTADEVGIAGLEIQKIAELTNGDFDQMMEKFHKLVSQQGYDKDQAMAALKEMQIQTMKTGINFDNLSDTFGKGLDNFSQIGPKIAELNSVFKLRLNPAAMTRMTSKERAQYITNALKNSNVDLNSRLLQRQLASVFGSEEASRKYLASIRNTNAATAEAVDATRKKLDAVGQETVSGSVALERLQKTAVDQMDPGKALALRQSEAAAQTQIKTAGGTDKLETRIHASYGARHAAQERLFAEMNTQGGKFIRDTVAQFQMLQTEFGKGPFAKINLGTIAAAAGTASDLGTKLAGAAMQANQVAISAADKKIKTLSEGKQTDADKKEITRLKSRRAQLVAANKELEGAKGSKFAEQLRNLTPEAFEKTKAYLMASRPAPDEKPTDQVDRVRREAKGAGKGIIAGAAKSYDSVLNSVDDLVKTIKTMPIVVKLNGAEIAKAVLQETGTGKN